MGHKPVYTVKVKKTKETIRVYAVASGGYYDYDNMGYSQPPAAVIANKKQFDKEELEFISQSDE